MPGRVLDELQARVSELCQQLRETDAPGERSRLMLNLRSELQLLTAAALPDHAAAVLDGLLYDRALMAITGAEGVPFERTVLALQSGLAVRPPPPPRPRSPKEDKANAKLREDALTALAAHGIVLVLLGAFCLVAAQRAMPGFGALAFGMIFLVPYTLVTTLVVSIVRRGILGALGAHLPGLIVVFLWLLALGRHR